MNNSIVPQLGPVLMGTLVTNCGLETVACYTNYLEQHISKQGKISSQLANFWASPALTDAHYWILENQVGKSWLRIIEDANAEPAKPLRNTGWQSLEVCVSNVDVLGDKLQNSPFKIIGPPTNLDVSDKIRAMQVIGLAGEVLYLTEIKSQVPPFELPTAQCAVDSLFIPVLCCHDRDKSLALYESIATNQGLSFETKITVINNEYGYDLGRAHPVATLQLADHTLIEIDQIAAAKQRPRINGAPPTGIAIVSFGVDDLDALNTQLTYLTTNQSESPYEGKRSACLRGHAGELIELIEKKSHQPLENLRETKNEI